MISADLLNLEKQLNGKMSHNKCMILNHHEASMLLLNLHDIADRARHMENEAMQHSDTFSEIAGNTIEPSNVVSIAEHPKHTSHFNNNHIA